MLSVQRIFWTTLVVGAFSGIGWMWLFNGVLGHAEAQESLLGFIIFQGIGALLLAIMHKRLINIWHLSIRHPGKPLQHNVNETTKDFIRKALD